MISGFVILSEPENMKYPYIEAIKSMIPVVDEMVVILNPLVEDGARAKLEPLGVRIVQAAFDLEEFGWISYGIARTTGYQACNGDTILMFDADGILHEQEVTKLKERLEVFEKDETNTPYAYWGKYRFYTPNLYHIQNKHSGIYSKRVLGDRFDFYRGRKGVPNLKYLKENEISKQFDITLYGYEHLWDTKEVFRKKIIRYGTMKDKLYNHPIKTKEEYEKIYMDNLKSKMADKGLEMSVEVQPKIIQPRLKSLTKKEFGYSWFS